MEKEEVERKYPHDDFMQGYLHQNIENSYTERKIERAKKQVEIKSYMLSNRMLYEQEKEIVKYNVQQIAENVVPWWDARDTWRFLEKSNIFI